MAMKKKTVYYRVDGCACLPGYVNVGDCDDSNVYAADGTPVPGAVITPAGECPQEVVVVCGNEGPPTPPAPITLDGTACDGSANPATGNPGELVQVVQAPGQVFSVRFCSDDNADFELSCGIDPATGHQIQTAYKIVAGAFELIKRWDVVTGTEWTGDPTTLQSCAGTKLEAEQTIMCDGTTSFIRWYVIEDGVPTGNFVDTTLDGQDYTPSGPVKQGSCITCEPTISSAFANDLSTLLPGTSISIQKDNCCALEVVTSAGKFVVSKAVTGYSTGDFNCPVTVAAVNILSGTCTLAEVVVTTQNAG